MPEKLVEMEARTAATIKVIGALALVLGLITVAVAVGTLITANRVHTIVNQRRLDLVAGCHRSNERTSAATLAAAASAVADGLIAKDPSQSPLTRGVRAASSTAHWEAAAAFVDTLVDCDRAYPLDGGGSKVIDERALRRVQDEIATRFGLLDPGVRTDIEHLAG